MKKLIITLILLASTNLFARENYHGIRYDYLLHYETGLVSAVVIDQWFDNNFLTFGVPIFLGLAKEYEDWRYGDREIRRDAYYDFGFTVLGEISGKFLSMSF